MRARRLVNACIRFICYTACIVLLCGCLDAEKTVIIVYDAATDTFTYLVVYQQIRGVPRARATYNLFHTATQPASRPIPTTFSGDDGSDDILAIQKNRASLIVGPFPSMCIIDFGMLKHADGQGEFCNVMDLSAVVTATTPGSTDRIRIIPGKFFERSKDNLCYYQAAVLPGQTMDSWIDAINRSNTDQSAALQQAIDAKRSEKGRAVTWQDTGKFLAKSIENYDGSDSADFPTNQYTLPFSIESLQMLLDQANRHRFLLHRRGSEVSIDLQLQTRDIDGAMGIIAQMLKAAGGRLKALTDPAIQQTIKNGVDGVAYVRGELAFIDAITLSKIDPHTLRINCDIVRYCTEATLRPTDRLADLGNESDWAENTAQLAEKDVPIDRDITVEHLQAAFLSGKLTPGQ